jgi:hypothetical protein
MSKFCYWNWEVCILDAFLQLILLHAHQKQSNRSHGIRSVEEGNTIQYLFFWVTTFSKQRTELSAVWAFALSCSKTSQCLPLSDIHSVFCLTTGLKPPPKRLLHIVRSRASSFKWEYTLLSLRSSNSFLRLLLRLLLTSISPFIFLSITCFRRQFLRKMWPSN